MLNFLMRFYLFIAIFMTTNSVAYSFETGRYIGVSADNEQACELDIVQNQKSITINKLECVDENRGRRVTAEPKELLYGIVKKYIKEFKMTMTITVKPESYIMNYSNKKKTESYDEALIFVSKTDVHYTFSIIQENIYHSWFDIVLKKID
jgi:hypothetical protein